MSSILFVRVARRARRDVAVAVKELGIVIVAGRLFRWSNVDDDANLPSAVHLNFNFASEQ